MSIAYGPRAGASKLVVANGKTFGDILKDNGLAGQKDLVAQYNWGTKVDAEINRALIELVGCATLDADPLKTVLDPDRGTGGAICKPEPWAATALPVAQTHTVKVIKRLPATTAAITVLPAFFNPGSATCPLQYLLDGDTSRGTRKDLEIRATGYYAKVKDKEGTGTTEVEKPSGTKTIDNVKETRILTKSDAGAPGPTDFTWKGESDAAVGILKSPAKVTSACAPYFVSVRYYKDSSDENTFIDLKPFYPRWKLTGKAKWDLIEESMEVAWKIQGEDLSKAKLKNGQIRLYDKDGLVFFAPLTAKQIADGKYNLLTETIHWDKSMVDQTTLPYRVQIQAHSDDEEDNGLALAVMPTQVPAYNYDQVQFIGFNVRNDTMPGGPDYLGDPDPDVDIAFRCEAMIEAMQLAKPHVSADRKVLKVFMAPEFYFRGKEGAYPVEKLSTIVPKMRVESDKYEYLDWLFVFGSALGYQKHEGEGSAPAKHGSALHKIQIIKLDTATQITAKVWSLPKNGWAVETLTEKKVIAAPPGPLPVDKDPDDGSRLLQITLDSTIGLVPGEIAHVVEPLLTIKATEPPSTSPTNKIVVASALCERIPIQATGNEVVAIGGLYWEVESNGSKGKIHAVEYVKAEGHYILTLDTPAAYTAGNKLELIEPKTSELFNVALMQKGWHAPHLSDGSLREVITFKEDLSHIDFAGIDSSKYYHPSGSGRTIRMHYTGNVPMLPTTGGKDIGGASPNLTRKPDSAVGSEINQNGQGGGCVIMVDRVTFGMEVCRDHCVDRLFNFYTGTNILPKDPQVQVQLIPSWGMSIGLSGPGKEVSTLLNGLVFNVDGSRMQSVARIWDKKYSCDSHITVAKSGAGKCTERKILLDAGKAWYFCKKCNDYLPSPCTKVGHTATPCDEDLKTMGSAFSATRTLSVPKSRNAAYFKTVGNVQVFPPKSVPPPDVAIDPPVLNTISSGNAMPGFDVVITLTGIRLQEVRSVTVDGAGLSVTQFLADSDSQVRAVLFANTSAAVGDRNVYVSTFSGRSNAMIFKVAAPPAPTLVSVIPDRCQVAYLNTIKLTGTNLQSVHKVEFSTASIFVVRWIRINPSVIELQISIEGAATIGPCTITITSAGGSATVPFVVEARPVPKVINIYPDIYAQGMSHKDVRIEGLDLVLPQSVTIQGTGVIASNYRAIDPQTLLVDIAVDALAASSLRDLTVTTASGTSAAYIVEVKTPPPPPTISLVDPYGLLQGFTYDVEIQGINLGTVYEVSVSGAGVAAAIISNTDTDIRIKITSEEAAAIGIRDITVKTYGGSATDQIELFAQPAPTLNSVTPNHGARGTSVTVTASATDVLNLKKFEMSGGKIAVTINSNTNDKVVATLDIEPGATPGARDLTITNHSGTSNAVVFTVT